MASICEGFSTDECITNENTATNDEELDKEDSGGESMERMLIRAALATRTTRASAAEEQKLVERITQIMKAFLEMMRTTCSIYQRQH